MDFNLQFLFTDFDGKKFFFYFYFFFKVLPKQTKLYQRGEKKKKTRQWKLSVNVYSLATKLEDTKTQSRIIMTKRNVHRNKTKTLNCVSTSSDTSVCSIFIFHQHLYCGFAYQALFGMTFYLFLFHICLQQHKPMRRTGRISQPNKENLTSLLNTSGCSLSWLARGTERAAPVPASTQKHASIYQG